MAMIAVTGASGFVGQNLMKRISARAYNRGDELNFEGIETVIHLACDANSRESDSHVSRSVEDNTGIFTKVLSNAVFYGVKRFIYISSIEAETEHNIYAICKATNEKILKVIAEKNGLDYVIIRPCNLYGPYMDLKDEKRNVVANFLRSLREKKPLNVLNNNAYPFTYVNVLIDNIIQSLTENTNKTIRVGSDLNIPLLDLAALLEGITTTWDWVKEQV